MLFCFALLLLTGNTLHSQNFKADRFQASDFDTMSTWELAKYDGLNMLKGVGFAYARPFHWGKNDFIRVGATAGIVSGVFLVDEDLSNWARRNKNDVPEIIRDFGWYFGSPQNNYGVTGAIYLTSLFSKNREWRRTGVLMISSATAGGVLQQFLKIAVGRARPETGKGKNEFRPFLNDSGYSSFPSGHTVLSFTTAYALAKHFENPWVKAGIYGVGLISPVSRIWSGAHYTTDVILSLAVVIATVEGVDRYLDTRNGYGKKRYGSKRKDGKVNWTLQATSQTVGVSLRF